MDLGDIQAFLNSQFLRSVLAALAGAGLGAWTAQYIAARNKKNDERLKEVRAANAAATIAYGITDNFLGMKHQIVQPTMDQYTNGREWFIQEDAKPKLPGTPPIRIKVPLDMFRFNWSPYKELQDIVFDELSPPVRAMMIVPILTRTLSMLDKLADDRNAMIKDFQETQKAGKPLNPYVYYGVPFPKGGADNQYANTIQHIADYTDDVIVFSQMLGDDLREFAIALRRALPRSIQPLAPRVVTFDFSRRGDVMPNRSKYQDYEALYQPIRVLGCGVWLASFEALALNQYAHPQEHWLS